VSAARSEILARLRAAAPKAALPTDVAPPEAPLPLPDTATLAARFAQEARAVGCVVHGPAAQADATDVVIGVLRELHAHALLAWDGGELSVPGLAEALSERGFRFADPALPAERAGRGTRLARLDQADVGLTGALAGLADTGSLVLASGAARPRLAWLLPPVHVALLKLDALHPSLDAFLAGRATDVAGNATLAVVTGPSRTGDIEQVLTRGVHGPGVLHVVLLT
jgi:L-lactate dehydrogenase complex protein LldG